MLIKWFDHRKILASKPGAPPGGLGKTAYMKPVRQDSGQRKSFHTAYLLAKFVALSEKRSNTTESVLLQLYSV